MSQNTTSNIDTRILYVLGKLREEYEIVKRQGFPSRKVYSRFERPHDALISGNRLSEWRSELDIDAFQLEDIFKIIQNEGLLEKYDLVPDYV